MTFEIIKQEVDVKPIEQQILERMECWSPLESWFATAPVFEGGGVIPLVVSLSETETYNTMYYDIFTAATEWLQTVDYGHPQQCGLYGLLTGMESPQGFDTLPFSEGRDRYCLVIAGNSKFVIGDQQHDLVPGVVFRYDNQLEHKWVAGDTHSAYLLFSTLKVESGEPIVLEAEQ